MARARSPWAGGFEALGERSGAGAQAGSASSPSPLVQGPGPATRAPQDRRAAGRAVALCEAVARRPPSARPRRAAERSASRQQPRPLGDPRPPPASPPPSVTVASAADPETALPVTPPLPRPPRPHAAVPAAASGARPGSAPGRAAGPRSRAALVPGPLLRPDSCPQVSGLWAVPASVPAPTTLPSDPWLWGTLLGSRRVLSAR